MGSFKKTRNFGGRDSGRPERSFKKFSGRSSGKFGESSDRPKFGSKESRSGNGFKLFEAVCDKCGKKCDLPFEPTSGKPIYCRSCFRETQSSSSGKSREFGPRRDRFESRSFDKFESRERTDDRSDKNIESKEQDTSAANLEKINKKLDKIMKALNIE
jgi:CxxC-x17-CxxC domain-containing protein